MEQHHSRTTAAEASPRRLYVYNGGFLNRRIRRILDLAGWRVTTGRPGPEDWVGVWGHSPTARRGEAIAARHGARLLRIEDAFLRSVRTGRAGEPPVGLQLSNEGVHFDSGTPSDLEMLLRDSPLDDTALLDRARIAISRLISSNISKYNAFDLDLPTPEPGYVLVVDQTSGDASISYSGARESTFREMLAVAQIEHPGQRILIRSHPETDAGHRDGHYRANDLTGPVEAISAAVSPWRLLEGATAVYTVSSQLGFEAILAGHRPRVFGQPFYAGWGLTEDEYPLARRQRPLTRAQLFAASMILHPTWYDPYKDRLCDLEEVIDGLEARLRAFREDRRGYVATGIRLWKRPHVRQFFGTGGKVVLRGSPTRAANEAARRKVPLLAWAGQADNALEEAALDADAALVRIEDGFLRSKGLGAELTPPLSLVADDLGIYYDPQRESRLERLIAEAAEMPAEALRRAERLQERLVRGGVSKYNTGSAVPHGLPAGRRILVAGQVEDDASIRFGCGEFRTNLALLHAAREANPDAVLIYKPHPDVEAGLRKGAVSRTEADGYADAVAERAEPTALIAAVDEVWTLTSLLGFEALLRSRKVTCLGVPFYAGWGLTRDLGQVPDRRRARPCLAALTHAALIAYPRYRDPVTGLPCPPEVIVDRLEAGLPARTGPANRLLSKLQGLLASPKPFWR